MNPANYNFAIMKYLRYFLFPFSVVYGYVMSIRNFLYDHDILHSKTYNIPIVSVGNLNTGGTGKSPMIELLIRMLQDNFVIATLSRGYKRTTSGFLEVSTSHTSMEVGDEPLQFKTNFPKVHVAVDANRRRGISELLNRFEDLEVILLDDAFQHRKVKPKISILLTSYNDLYTKDFMLPTGHLREFPSGANRANCIIVTKCPNLISEKEKTVIKKIFKPRKEQYVLFSTIVYADLVYSETITKKLKSFDDFTLVTGIANPKPLVAHLKSLGKNPEHLAFPDHHEFTDNELISLDKKSKILTTQKDYMRLKTKLKTAHLYYIPIQTQLLDSSNFFQSYLEEQLL